MRRDPVRVPLLTLHRDLSEGQVLRKSRRGELLGSARQQREKRPARSQRAASAATEPRWHLRPAERVLDEADVVLRGSHQHGHLVEAHTGTSLAKDAPGDFDRLPSFAGSREKIE